MQLEGVYSVLPTPFTAAGDVDDDSLRRVVDLFIGAGVNGVTVLGVTGEVARLDDRERQRVLETVTSHVNGRIGVVAGTTAEGTLTCIGYSRAAKAAGATAVMVSPPRMPKLNSEAVVRHYHALAEAVDIDLVVQDYPPISGYAMEPWLLARVAKEIPRARTIKLEDPPTPFKTSRILEQTAGLDVRIFGGLGGVFLLEELMAGATGAMTGFAYPESSADRQAVPCRRDRRSGRSLLSIGPVDAVRVPGRDRHGDPERGAASPRRAGESRDESSGRRARRDNPSGTRSRAEVDRHDLK